jgi:hypothetical protein
LEGVMPGGCSIRELARRLGVSERAVRKAEAAGIFGAAVERDAGGVPMVVDEARAVRAWVSSGRKVRGRRQVSDVIERKPEDLVKLDERFSASVDLIDARFDEQGAPRANAVRIVIVAGPGDELPLPVFGARAALELAMMLLCAASVVDRDLVGAELARQRTQNALLGQLLTAPVAGTH